MVGAGLKKWILREVDTAAVKAFSKETGLSGLVSSVLAGRGIGTRAEADVFFGEKTLEDPMLVLDMEKACKIITEALHAGEKITVYGDYDCDGITSTVMLYQYLTALGGEVGWYIPSRDEGYGLNLAAIDKIAADGTRLIITVDNGISAHAEARYIKEKGMRLIITDHHQVPAELPHAEAILNPHRPGDSSAFKKLAGCGVVLKLIMALEDGDESGVMEQFAELAAIGTVADIVPLVGENRHIVETGLANMRNTDNIGLYQLLRLCGFVENEGKLTSTSLAFTICPRMNAAGRFAHAAKAVELLLCENDELAEAKAQELTHLNTLRQETEQKIVNEAEAILSADKARLNQRVLILTGEGWHHGVIGIVSSRLLAKYGKPVIVITIEGKTARGSARSIDGFSLYEMLTHSAHLLLKYGGHAKAAGFMLETAKLMQFTEAVEGYTREFFPDMPVASLHIDKELEKADLTVTSVEQLAILAPFGEENPSPVFSMRGAEITSKKSLKDGKYVAFGVRFQGAEQRILHFGCTYEDFRFSVGECVDLLLSLDINEYGGTRSVSAQVKDIRPAGFAQDKYIAASFTYEKLCRREAVDPRLVKRIIPESADIRRVYDIVRRGGRLSAVCAAALAEGLNYCMTRVILDVLEEFSLVKADVVHDTVELVPAVGKANLEDSELLRRLRAEII